MDSLEFVPDGKRRAKNMLYFIVDDMFSTGAAWRAVRQVLREYRIVCLGIERLLIMCLDSIAFGIKSIRHSSPRPVLSIASKEMQLPVRLSVSECVGNKAELDCAL